jgi:hypothetical protein
MRRVLLLLLGCALAGSPAAAQQVSIEASGLQSAYLPGESGEISFFLQLHDDAGEITEGVWFLNIVKPSGGGNVKQVAHLLFASAQEDPVAFRRVFSGGELQEGVAAGLSFHFRSRIEPGDYDMVLQLFEGSNTDPGRVAGQRRLAIKSFPFRVD